MCMEKRPKAPFVVHADFFLSQNCKIVLKKKIIKDKTIKLTYPPPSENIFFLLYHAVLKTSCENNFVYALVHSHKKTWSLFFIGNSKPRINISKKLGNLYIAQSGEKVDHRGATTLKKKTLSLFFVVVNLSPRIVISKMRGNYNKSSIYPDKYLNFTSKISSECSHLLFVFWRPWYSKERRKRQNIFLKNLILTFCLKVGAYFWILFGAKVVSVNRVLWLVWGFFRDFFLNLYFVGNTPRLIIDKFFWRHPR